MRFNKKIPLFIIFVSSFVLLLTLYKNKFTFYKIQEFGNFWIYSFANVIILIKIFKYVIQKNKNCKLKNNVLSNTNKILLKFGNISYKSLADSNYYITNPRKNKLHIQYKLVNQPKAIILFLHGYGSHCSRPTHQYFEDYFTYNSYSYISFDFEGHGRSMGTRGIVESPENLIDDSLFVLLHFYKNILNNIPFFIFGHSMGGGIAILLSYLISSNNPIFTTLYFQNNKKLIIEKLQGNFRGCVLFCPVIQLTKMFPCICFSIISTLAYFFPNGSIPTFIINENDYNDTSWADPEYRSYIFEDGYPKNPNGLSYGGNINFRTLNTLLEIAKLNLSIAKFTKFPWIIFHDPKDKIVSFNGSKKFLLLSPSTNKKIIQIPGGLHDIIANQVENMASKSLSWITNHL